MMETLFDAGRRHATSQAAFANYDATVAGYRQTRRLLFNSWKTTLRRFLSRKLGRSHRDQAANPAGNLGKTWAKNRHRIRSKSGFVGRKSPRINKKLDSPPGLITQGSVVQMHCPTTNFKRRYCHSRLVGASARSRQWQTNDYEWSRCYRLPPRPNPRN